jgi:capsular exopolysaccharide synthesis family protein
MSHIHEALKKAAQERAMQPGSALEAGLGEIMAEIRRPAITEASVVPFAGQDGVTTAGSQSVRDPLAEETGLGNEAIRHAERTISTNGRHSVSSASGFLRLDELRQCCAKPAWKVDPEDAIFCQQSFSPCAEQFRTLRSRLYQLRQERPLRTLLVTSATPTEGKTFVALNLAQAIARQHERSVLLIDADLRCSRLHDAIGAPSAPGLADFLQGTADEFSTIQVDTKDNFFFIPAGNPVSNPAELLSNTQLRGLLDRLGSVFDWIILDAPPVLPVSDAGILAGLCDGVLFVVRAGSTAFDLAQMAYQDFRGKNLVGVVLNRVEDRAAYGAYSYYPGKDSNKR